MPGPLTGMRVIDCSTMVSGPMASLILAEQGAAVVKVEAPPPGDVLRIYGSRKGGMSGWFANTNRGKQGIVVDLEQADGAEAVRRLAEGADVFIQNYRPGVAERLGVGAERMLADHPELVYVSISGFGDSGPYVGRRAYDPMVQAMSGLAGLAAGNGEEPPALVRSMLADKITAMTAAQAITAAYTAVVAGGPGQHVRVNMLDAVIAFLWPDAMMHCTLLDDDGVTAMPNLMASYRLAKASDGYLTIGVATDDQFRALWRALGRPEVAEEERFATAAARALIWNEVISTYEAEVARFTLAELLVRLEAEDVPHAAVLRGEEVVHDPQVMHNGTIEEVDHPVAGRLRQPRHPARFDGTPVAPTTPAPTAGQHTDELLTAAGYTAEEVAALRKSGVVG